MTLNGPLTYSRYILRPIEKDKKLSLVESIGTKGIAPLDCALGIDKLPFKMTINMMLLVAYFAQEQSSYQAAEDLIKRVYGITVNDDTIRLVANYIGEMVFKEDCRRAEETYAKFQSGQIDFSHDRKGVLYVEADGAALNTRHKNNDGSTWRENKLGVVFSSDAIHRWTSINGKKSHRILHREYVSYVGGVQEFSKHLLDCAVRNGYGRYKEVVLLSDGAAWIKNMHDELFPDAEHILDYFHLCENVYDYAKSTFGLEEEKYKPWSQQVCAELKSGNAQSVLRELSKSKPKKASNDTVNLKLYIQNNINKINYPEYEEKGYFIGSGAIESGNKIVLQHRLKQAGMRWNPRTAQSILTLKAKNKSGLWEKHVTGFVRKKLLA